MDFIVCFLALENLYITTYQDITSPLIFLPSEDSIVESIKNPDFVLMYDSNRDDLARSCLQPRMLRNFPNAKDSVL